MQDKKTETEVSEISKIAERIKTGTDLFDRGGSYQFVPVDKNTLPPELLSIFSKYLIDII